jgi:hypothetical protein
VIDGEAGSRPLLPRVWKPGRRAARTGLADFLFAARNSASIFCVRTAH